MILARVIGDVTATVKHPILDGEKLLMLKTMKPDGTLKGAPLIALDRAQAGPGDTVLILDEGNSARMMLGIPRAPMRTVIVGVVDRVDVPQSGGRHGR